MSDEIVEPWHGQTFISANPPPSHTHPQADVTDLVIWQASIERSLAEKREDIDLLKRCFVALVIILTVLSFTVLALSV